jgi:hypothetical protein
MIGSGGAGAITLSEAHQVLIEVYNRRGYLVFVGVEKKVGLRITRFTNGEYGGIYELPQPFILLHQTDRADWDEQCLMYREIIGNYPANYPLPENPVFMRGYTD